MKWQAMKSSRNSLFFLLVLSVVISSTLIPLSVGYRNRNLKLKELCEISRGLPGSDYYFGSALAPLSNPFQPGFRTFDILSFGAKGDGVADDSKALLATWKAACVVPHATLKIPSEFKFLIKPVTLRGPCMPHLVLQINGEILAPSSLGAWSKSNSLQWVNFKWLHHFTVQGTGAVNGQGSSWWNSSQIHSPQKRSRHLPVSRPTALRFYGSSNVTVHGISIFDSPLCHLKFDSCEGVKVTNITISSPRESPNTDGIHLQNTQDVEIKHSHIGCGDDCVSIQTGCSNVHVHHIKCNPGHGISIGSLGKDKSMACVSNITVENISVQNALSSARIKTWQGGLGSVKNVTFSKIQVSGVEIPIVIDQYYCNNKKLCKNETKAVEISGIKYEKISGTYSLQPMHLACSDSFPCTSIELINIQLSPTSKFGGFQEALCWKSYGESQGPIVPSSIDCLQRGSNLLNALEKSRNHVC